MKNRLLAFVLAVSMMFQMTGFTSFASEVNAVEEFNEEAAHGAYVTTFYGKMGAPSVTVYCNLEDSTKYDLVFDGTGDMDRYTSESVVPWRDYKANIVSVTLSSGITNISQYAFNRCSSLKYIEFPAKTASIGNSAFAYCTSLPAINIPANVSSIGTYAFEGCSSAESLTLPSRITSIGSSAFQNCSKIKELVIPSNVQSIGGAAFKWCTALERIVVNSSVSVSTDAFGLCTSIKDIVVNEASIDVSSLVKQVPDMSNVTLWVYRKSAALELALEKGYNFRFIDDEEMPENAFLWDDATKTLTVQNVTKAVCPAEYMATVKNVIIMPGVESVDDWGFRQCVNLESIQIPESVNAIGENAFLDCSGDLTIEGFLGSYAETYAEISEIPFVSIDPKFTVTFNYCDNDKEDTDLVILQGAAIGTLPTASRSHYTFEGWFTAKEGGDEISADTVPSEDMTVYAHWTPDQFKVTLDVNGGDALTPDYFMAEYDSEYGTGLKIPTREDYKFLGWYTAVDDGEEVTAKDVCTGEVTLYAHWAKLTCEEKGHHTYSTEWSSDETYHWKVATCEHTEEVAEKGEHSFTEAGICSACGKQKPEETPGSGTEETPGSGSEEIPGSGTEPEIDWVDVIEADREYFKTLGEINEESYTVIGVKDTEYTGTTVTFDLRVYQGKHLLKEGVDYSVAYKYNKLAADANSQNAPQVIITGKGDYKRILLETKKFNIIPADISSAVVTNPVVEFVNKKMHKPVPVVTLLGKKLKAGTDYKISYGEGRDSFTEVGTYTIYISGCGNYRGSLTSTFKIVEKNSLKLLSKVSVRNVKAMQYDGSKKTQNFDARFGGVSVNDLLEVSYKDNVEIGTATMILTPKEGSGFVGEKIVTFAIKGIAISRAKVDIEDSRNQFYDSGLKIPKVTLTFDQKELDPKVDYDLTYQKNIHKGTAYIILKGKGRFSGTVKKSFAIKAVKLTADDEKLKIYAPEVVAYVGNVAHTPDVKVTYNGRLLVKNVDYTVSYKNNKREVLSTAKSAPQVVIKGKDNYAGTVSKAFSIVK